jgi:hypothetical protein
MSLQKIRYSRIGVGGFIVLFMFLANVIGLGKGGIRAASSFFSDRLVAGPHMGMNT